ncbi:NUDIX hydrolase, partial [bacterium]|nr:NUDIX hydrolase [bacterium]
SNPKSLPQSRFKYCPECGGDLLREMLQGRLRLRCQKCGEIHYENPLPATACVCRNDRGELLLVKRADPPAKGEWCLPGGFIEVGETAHEGALRELKEETGLEGRILRVIDVSSRVNGYWGDVILIGYEVETTGGELQAADDAAEAKYYPLDALPPIPFNTHQRMIDVIMSEENP